MGDVPRLHYVIGSATHPASCSVCNTRLFPGFTFRVLCHSLPHFMPQTIKKTNVGRRDIVVIICTTYFNIQMSVYRPQFSFMCSVLLSQEVATVSLNGTNRLVIIMVKRSVFCTVGNESENPGPYCGYLEMIWTLKNTPIF
jgi:hypothetical protein